MIKCGIYPNLSNDEYHSDAAISRSGIMNFLDSPYKYWSNYLNKDKELKITTASMKFGSAFHKLILERDTFYDDYIREPIKKYLKYDGEVIYRAYQEELKELAKSLKIILTDDEMYTLDKMENALREYPQALDLIEENVYEQSYFWEDPHTGIMCKARPDIIADNYVVDLKTIHSASPHYFQRAMAEHGYHIQAAMIRDAVWECAGKDIKTFINICVEKTYPYQIGIYIIDEEAIEIGKQEYKQALLDLKSCVENKKWPSYEIQTIGLPTWKKK